MAEPADHDPVIVGLAEASAILDMRPPNVRAFLIRRGLVPQELKAGPVWRRVDVTQARREWDAERAGKNAATAGK